MTRSPSLRPRSPRVGLSLGALALVLAAARASRAELGEVEAPPAPPRSVRVLRADELLYAGANDRAARRGAARRDVLLPLFARKTGSGCAASWLQVGPQAWICGDHVELSPERPIAADAAAPEPADGLPLRYHFVGRDGSFAYKRIERADVGEPDLQLEPGFSVGVVEERTLGGVRYAHTNKDLWVPVRDLAPARTFLFEGAEASGGKLDVGWVVVDQARSRDAAGVPRPGGSARQRFDRVDVLERKRNLVRVGEGEWLLASELRIPTVASPPSEVDVAGRERWIDVELESQTLVAYEGDKPAFATIVSTGKGRPGTDTATPKGTFRIWIKLRLSDMDNLEDPHASRYYRMEDVPYVQYFSKGVGLHAAYWHRSFGQLRSHGCVNLAPLDAQRLFRWTGPRVPAGWSAVTPTPWEPGTLVRVR